MKKLRARRGEVKAEDACAWIGCYETQKYEVVGLAFSKRGRFCSEHASQIVGCLCVRCQSSATFLRLAA